MSDIPADTLPSGGGRGSRSKEGWPLLVRRYLALRDTSTLAKAINGAPAPVADYLKAFAESNMTLVNKTLPAVLETVGGAESADGRTLRLVQADMSCRLSEKFNQFDPSQQQEMLKIGLRACRAAIDLARLLDDFPCLAFFTSVSAHGFSNSKDRELAEVAYREALGFYRTLSQDQPKLYLSRVAMTLNNLANVRSDLRQLDLARDAFEEALDIWRSLAQTKPAVHRADVAMTLNSLGNVLRDLRLLDPARDAYAEALSIRRSLGRGHTAVNILKVAGTLNNLGNVLRDLGLLDSARDAYAEALDIWRSIAHDRPAVIRDVAMTLNNLGNVLRDLRLLDSARDAYKEALGIYRSLPQEQHAGCLPNEIAMVLNNLGNLLRDLRLFVPSRDAYAEALSIWRTLAQDQPAVYRPDVAMVLNNLGNVLRDLRLLASSRDAFSEALSIWQALAQEQPAIYGPDVAMTLNNLGNVLRDMRRLDASRGAYDEALGIYRTFSQDHTAVYISDVAMTLNNLGNVLHDLRLLDASRNVYTEALAIRRSLARDQPAIHLPSVAMTLDNLGNVLRALGLLDPARDALEEALGIRRSLAQAQPAPNFPDVAMTLNNLGNVFRDLRLSDPARRSYREAALLFSQAQDLISEAIPWANLARLEGSAGSREDAIACSQQSIHVLERGLAGLSETGHHDKFKRDSEDAYIRLISEFAVNADATLHRQLPGLFEALRKVDVLSAESGGAAPQRADPFEGVEQGSSALADRLMRLGGAFLWMQDTGDSTVFALLRPGSPLQVGLSDCAAHLKNLLEPRHLATRKALGQRAWAALPAWMKDALLDPTLETLFISPCGASAPFPLEYLWANDDGWLGLQKLMVRTHGLFELEQVLPRQCTGREAFVVGNPPRPDAVDLPFALQAAQEVHRAFSEASDGWSGGEPKFGVEATRVAILEQLGRAELGVFHFNGHGTPESLALAGEDMVSFHDVGGMRWPGCPLVHYDCCFSGLAWSRGGGRFEGMPIAAFQAGAGAVVASAVPLYDAPAAYFSQVLYDGLLQHKLNVGEAMMAARRATHAAFPEDPHHWASSVLWGNPELRLRANA